MNLRSFTSFSSQSQTRTHSSTSFMQVYWVCWDLSVGNLFMAKLTYPETILSISTLWIVFTCFSILIRNSMPRNNPYSSFVSATQLEIKYNSYLSSMTREATVGTLLIIWAAMTQLKYRICGRLSDRFCNNPFNVVTSTRNDCITIFSIGANLIEWYR